MREHDNTIHRGFLKITVAGAMALTFLAVMNCAAPEPMQNLMTCLGERGELTPAQQYHIEKSKPVEELYDLEADPHEINNIADDPALGGVLAGLRGKLETWICETLQ